MTFAKAVTPTKIPRPNVLSMHGGVLNNNTLDSKTGAAFFREMEKAYNSKHVVLTNFRGSSQTDPSGQYMLYEAWIQEAGAIGGSPPMPHSDNTMANWASICADVEQGKSVVVLLKDELILAEGQPVTVHISCGVR